MADQPATPDANAVPPGKVPVVDPYGQIGTMDLSEAHQAIQKSGFRPATPEEFQNAQDQATYGSGLGNAAKSFGLGVANAASFGTIPYALAKTGLYPSEEQAKVTKYNPGSNLLGQGVGIGGMLLAPELGAARAIGKGAEGATEGASVLSKALNPVKAVGEAGEALANAVKPVSQKLANLAANPETSPIINKILANAPASAMGSALEGAAYGLGQSVNESALGDPDALGEKLLSNVGYSAMFAGGLGALFGPLLKAGNRSTLDSIPQAVSEVETHAIPEESIDFAHSVRSSDLSSEEKEGILSGLTKQRPDAPALREAAQRLGAPVLESQTTDSDLVRKADSLLLNGPPTFSSLRRQALYKQGYEAADHAVQDTLGGASQLSKAEIGDQFKQSLAQKVSAQNEPISQLYDTLKESYEAIPLSERSAPSIAKNIRDLDEVRISPSSPQAKIANRVADELENLKTVDDVKRYRSLLNQSISPTASSGEKHIISVLSDKLKDLEENSVVRFAQNEMKTGQAKERILGLLDQREAANAQYKALMDKVGTLAEALGKKRVYGPQDFLNFLDDLTPEKVTDKLFTKNNSGFLSFFKKEFPDEMKLLAQYQKGSIYQDAVKNASNEFRMNTVFRHLDKLQPEIKKALFTPEELQKLDDAKLYMSRMPKEFNPSHTSDASAFREFAKSPTGAAIANVRDYGLEKFVKLSGGKGTPEDVKIAGLGLLERSIQKTTNSIVKKTKDVFSSSSGMPAIGFVGSQSAQSFQSGKSQIDSHEKIRDQINSINNDPEKMIDQLQGATAHLFPFAPDTAQGVHMAATRATQFLASKLPQPTVHLPLSPKYIPSKSELARFDRYYSAVQNPIGVLDQVKSGTITPESLETLQTVYPKLLNEMQTNVMSELTKFIAKDRGHLSFPKKMALSLFLGQDLDESTTQTGIAANQIALAQDAHQSQANSSQAQPVRVSQKGLSNLKSSGRLLTAMQSSAQRGQNEA